MIDLSIVIVNYNVKFFLEQCLNSVFKAVQRLTIEVFVVDNNSVDGSAAMVKNKFPGVKLIENKENVGFSKANNQAIKQSQGRYILLLNPDTVIEESTLVKVVQFMDNHPEAGGLGVKMIDGKGKFLPESKRGLPTPFTAFYKIFGLSYLFPKSKLFGKYHLGFLDKEKIHQVEVLSGAFMLIRKDVLSQIGLLDEDYFMYGEDIDLSYRILKSGYKNYYFPETTIIHYKGESTKKGSLNYVMVFYKAMLIFSKKHFSGKNALLFNLFILLAVYFRATLAIFSRFFGKILLPLIDTLILFSGFIVFAPLWGKFRFGNVSHFPPEYIYYVVPAYVFIWLMVMIILGVYDKPYKISKIPKSILIGSFIILVIYALLPESLRFSRVMIFLGTIWSILLLFFYRFVLFLLGFKTFRYFDITRKRLAIVGDKAEIERVEAIILQMQHPPLVIGYILPSEKDEDSYYLGNCLQISDIVKINKIDEIVFCAQNVEAYRIIQYMLLLSGMNVEFKIAQPDSMSIVGSSSVHTRGELYSVNLNTIVSPVNRRLKRLFDILISVLILICYPILVFYTGKPLKLIRNTFSVLFGIKTWVGYIQYDPNINDLPLLKKGIFFPHYSIEKYSDQEAHHINVFYAKDYSPLTDLSVLANNLKYL